MRWIKSGRRAPHPGNAGVPVTQVTESAAAVEIPASADI